MVFTGIPGFLDAPIWQQGQRGLAGVDVSAAIKDGDGGSSIGDNQQISMLHPPPSELVPGTMADVGAARPILMADRDRQAKVQPPDTALKCPRCESTNTKFCYYNNYSLTQPRHFCKTCRRYWTKGGALRNVPVGGGFRRNKRSKNSSGTNKAPAIETSSATSSGGATMNVSSSNCTGELVGMDNQPHLPVIPFLPSIHGFSNYCGGPITTGYLAFPGCEFGSSGIGTSLGLDFPVANEHGNNHGQWRMQHNHHQLPPLSRHLLLPYDGGEGLTANEYLATAATQLKTRPPIDLISQSNNAIKLEDHQSENQLAIHFTGSGWGDLPNFPSTTSSFL